MSRILITDGAGFIGSHLAEFLADDSDNEVVVVDNLLTGHQEYLKRPLTPLDEGIQKLVAYKKNT